MLDAFVEAGGNFFDTAHAYSSWLPGGNGLSEISIGDYVRRRGLKEITIATKGGHPSGWRYRTVEQPLSSARLGADIDDSLARLECETISLYYLHRDDPRIPAGELIETLNAEIARGRIRHLAASQLERSAHRRGQRLRPQQESPAFVISEPRWSLATRASKTLPDVGAQMSWHRESGLRSLPTARRRKASSPGRRRRRKATTRRPKTTPAAHAPPSWPRDTAPPPRKSRSPGSSIIPSPFSPILGTKSPERLREAIEAESIRLTELEVAWLEGGRPPERLCCKTRARDHARSYR